MTHFGIDNCLITSVPTPLLTTHVSLQHSNNLRTIKK